MGGVTRTLSYGYNAAGQRTTMTTPSGQQIGYTYLNSRVSAVTVNGATLAGGIVTTPFGPSGAWQWGNGLYTFRYYDGDGRMSGWTFRNGADVLRNDLTFDPASRITAIANPITPTIAGAYQYDALDRLAVAQQGNPVTHTEQFSYDALGNRTSFNLDGAAATLYYGANTNQLQSMGGAVSAGYLNGATSLAYTYNNANRLTQVQSSGATVASYAVNALGQRVQKTAGATITRFVYDEQGRLLGEYDGTGQLIQETVWLDDLPIATLRPTGTGTPTPIAIYYVHADHLGSPRAVTRPADNQVMWRWDNSDPFGNNAANENPAGQGAFQYGMRFPGQYYDAETGTHYKYFRDYDPGIGRYAQSDPIGLRGGTNTYQYADLAPTSRVDPFGLLTRLCSRPLGPLPFQLGPLRHDFIDLDGFDWGLHCARGEGTCPYWGPGVVKRNVAQTPFTNCQIVDCIDEARLFAMMMADEARPPSYHLICIGGMNCQSWARQKLTDALDAKFCKVCRP